VVERQACPASRPLLFTDGEVLASKCRVAMRAKRRSHRATSIEALYLSLLLRRCSRRRDPAAGEVCLRCGRRLVLRWMRACGGAAAATACGA
jgi:hypothetical protein